MPVSHWKENAGFDDGFFGFEEELVEELVSDNSGIDAEGSCPASDGIGRGHLGKEVVCETHVHLVVLRIQAYRPGCLLHGEHDLPDMEENLGLYRFSLFFREDLGDGDLVQQPLDVELIRHESNSIRKNARQNIAQGILPASPAVFSFQCLVFSSKEGENNEPCTCTSM